MIELRYWPRLLVADQAWGSLQGFWARQQCLASARGFRTHVAESRQAVFAEKSLTESHRTMRACDWELRLMAVKSPELLRSLPYGIKKAKHPIFGVGALAVLLTRG